jgi:hypothetical protein
MIDNLKKQRDIIAFEASIETQITDFMKSGFERVYGDVRGFLSGFATPPTYPKITKENKDFLNIVAKTSFVELMSLLEAKEESLGRYSLYLSDSDNQHINSSIHQLYKEKRKRLG